MLVDKMFVAKEAEFCQSSKGASKRQVDKLKNMFPKSSTMHNMSRGVLSSHELNLDLG